MIWHWSDICLLLKILLNKKYTNCPLRKQGVCKELTSEPTKSTERHDILKDLEDSFVGHIFKYNILFSVQEKK